MGSVSQSLGMKAGHGQEERNHCDEAGHDPEDTREAWGTASWGVRGSDFNFTSITMATK